MEQKHKQAIQSNFSSLVEQTDLDSVVTALYEKGVFSEQMIEPYKNNNVPERDRKRKLYLDIKRRGPHAFRHLVDVLGELGYWRLAQDLDPDGPFSSVPPRNFNPAPKPRPQSSDDDNFHSLSRPKAETRKPSAQTSPPQPPLPPPPQPDSENDNAAGDLPTPQFTVIKSTRFMKDDDMKDLKLYKTRGRERGVLIYFVFKTFVNDIEPAREGVDVDSENLSYLFRELGFKPIRYANYTREQLISTLKSLNTGLVGYESVFIVVSSHGHERAGTSDIDVRCSDGKLISVYNILEHFNNDNMPALRGVPKVFIFQMCRGGGTDYTWQEAPRGVRTIPMPAGDVAPDGRPDSALRERMLLYSDILIAHSTLPGQVAYRDKKSGSWYIQVLCEVFANRAHDCHVEKLFTLVDQRMQDKFQLQTSSVDRWGFNKRLYLHPGLYETN